MCIPQIIAGAGTAIAAISGAAGTAATAVGSAKGLALTGLAMGAANAGLQTYGAYQQAEAQNKAIEYNTTIANQNIALQDAKIAESNKLESVELSEKQQRLQLFMADQDQAFAASGVGPGGSRYDVLADSKIMSVGDDIDIAKKWSDYRMNIAAGRNDMVASRDLMGMQKRNKPLSALTAFGKSAAPLIPQYGMYRKQFG